MAVGKLMRRLLHPFQKTVVSNFGLGSGQELGAADEQQESGNSAKTAMSTDESAVLAAARDA
jgi:hypothetical protein